MNTEKNIFSPTRIIIIILIGIGIWIFIPKVVGLKETFNVLKEIKYWALILALLAESFFYIGSTLLTKTVLAITKDKLTFYDILKISIMDSFSVQFLPLGTFGEAAVDYHFYKQKNIRSSHIILLFISRTIIIWLIFAFIYLVGVAFSPANPEMTISKSLFIWIIYFSGFALLFYLIWLYLNRNRLTRTAQKLLNLANRITKLLHLKVIKSERLPDLIDKIYQATNILSKNPKLQLASATSALIYWFGDIFCLYFSFLGFGFKPHLTIVIFAYCITKILSTASFIPGGLGVAEASLGLIFIGFGTPAATAFAAVLSFRFISFWLPIPLGFWSFLSLQRNSKRSLLSLSES